MDERTNRIYRILTRTNAKRVLVILTVITAILGSALRNAKLDYDFEKFFPSDDPELDHYNDFRSRFGGENEVLMVGIPRNEGVYNTSFLQQVDSLTSLLSKLDNVRQVTSPTRISEAIITPIGAFNTPYLRVMNDSTLVADSTRIANDPRIRDNFFSADGKALLMLIDTETGLSKIKSDVLLKDVDTAIERSGLTGVQLAGRIHGQYHYIRMMLEELILFLTASIILLAFFLWWAFRSLWGVLVPIATVGLAILWQVGAMSLFGQSLSILTILLPTILFVVGMSDVVHILEHYLDELRNNVPRREAIAHTYQQVGLPTFLTAVTAGIGFATLGTANIQPLQEFGWFTAIGVLLTFLIAFTLLPAILIFVGPGKLLPVSDRPSPWDRRLPDLFRFTLRNRNKILVAFTLITLMSIYGITKVQVNTYLLDAWPEEAKEELGVRFFDKQFGGIRPFELEIAVTDTNGSIWELQVLKEIEKVEQKVASIYGVKGVLSPVTIMRSLNKAFNGGQASYYRIPNTDDETESMARKAKMISGTFLNAIVTQDGKHARLSGRMLDDGSALNKVRNAEFANFLQREIDPEIAEFRLTGLAYLIDRNNETLSTQLMGGMSLAVVITALIMLWFFRDPRMVLVALIPNLVPLLFIAGIIGYFHIDLKVSTAIIFSIAFGIAEDDTIHMLAKFRLQLREGKSTLYALKRTYLTTGKAVTVTGLMLISGFITLLLSNFGSIYDMGLLVTLTLAFALITELFLMPVLIILIRPKAINKK